MTVECLYAIFILCYRFCLHKGAKKRNEELTTVQYNASIIVDQLPSVKASECLLKKIFKSVNI